jgi:hypothetical protein
MKSVLIERAFAQIDLLMPWPVTRAFNNAFGTILTPFQQPSSQLGR